MKIETLRSLKKTFIRLKLHKLVGPFENFFQQLLWMSKLSRWAAQNKNVPGNDFPSEWDYEKRYTLYNRVFKQENLDAPIHYLEFGVADGHSFRWWLNKNTNPASSFHGFDTFTGLPEDFGQFSKGTFDRGFAVPKITDNRGTFYPGLFQQTLPPFLKGADLKNKLVVMLDADLYSSTLFVLASLAPFLKTNDILFFDEFGVPAHEFMAYQNFLESFYQPLQIIGAANNFYFTAFRVG